MLSSELSKRKDDCHLQSLLDKINSPHPPPLDSQDGKKFQELVWERLEERKLLQLSEISDEDAHAKEYETSCFPSSNLCQCPITCCSKSKKDEPEVVWRRMDCKTLESFEKYANSALRSNLNCIRCLRAIIQSFSFWEDPHPDWEGLSVVGSYMWILSFSIQHIVDEEAPKDVNMIQTALDEIKSKYCEIAQSGEMFTDIVEKFHEHARRLRSDGVYTVKKLLKKWRIDKESPMQMRPEHHQHNGREPKRRIGKGMGEIQNEMDLFQETAFHLNWTPLNIMLKSKKLNKIGWKDFGMLVMNEKLHFFKIFEQRVLDLLQMEAENMTNVSSQIDTIDVEGYTPGAKVHAIEISGALLQFSKSCKAPQHCKPEDTANMIRIISQYWYSVDILHEESHKLLHLVRETRDIIRTCYIYTDIFYKWDLPSYDQYLVVAPAKGRGSTQTLSNMKEAWGRYFGKGSGTRRLSDISEMLVLMDFSTSAYQSILEVRPVVAGDMMMKLEADGMDDVGMSFGLVSNDLIKKINKS